MVRLVCTEGGSRKFWEAEVVGKTLKARWGRIGTEGQSKDKACASPSGARAEYDRLVREKTKKGYVVEADAKTTTRTARSATRAAEPTETAATGDAASSITADVVTDAGTVVLFDAKHFAKVVDRETWEKQFVDDEEGIERHARLKHLAVLLAGSDGAFRVDVRRAGALTPAEEKKVQARTTSELVVKGAVFVAGIEYVAGKPDVAAAKAVALGAGRWSVTSCVLDGGRKMADVVVLLAPVGSAKADANAAAMKASEQKAANDRAKAEASAGAPPKTLKQAAEAALAGDIDRALPVLEAHAAKGSASAWSALAQIRAYRGDWSGALDAAAKLLADPVDIYAGNVTDEARWLLLRAGHVTGRWADVAKAIQGAKPQRADHGKHPLDAFLVKQARAGGTLADPPFDSADEHLKGTPKSRRAHYDAWMARIDGDKRRKHKPGDREEAQFHAASTYGQDEITMHVWAAVERGMTWENVLTAARVFARNGKADEAWDVLRRRAGNFWPVERAQVAPVEPLVDEALRAVMTPARLAELLAAPKGGTAAGRS